MRVNNPSRKLDMAIAEALGYKVDTNIVPWMMSDNKSVPLYSEDGNAMLELDKEMRARGWRLHLPDGDERYNYVASFQGRFGGKFQAHIGFADTMPLAVTLAAYKALTGKEWNE